MTKIICSYTLARICRILLTVLSRTSVLSRSTRSPSNYVRSFFKSLSLPSVKLDS